jgi:hypothetical protein
VPGVLIGLLLWVLLNLVLLALMLGASRKGSPLDRSETRFAAGDLQSGKVIALGRYRDNFGSQVKSVRHS